MASLAGILFDGIDKFWLNLRRFSYRNRSAMEVAFIFIYALEQVLLILYTFTADTVEGLGLVVSLFAIIVLTTFSLHKLVMESRIKLLEQEINEAQHDKFALESYAKQVEKEYYSLSQKMLSEDLNSAIIFNTQKRLNHGKKQ